MILKSIGKYIVLENNPLLNSSPTWGRGILVYNHLDRLDLYIKILWLHIPLPRLGEVR